MCWIIVKSDLNVSMHCDFIKKWLKNYTCNECEDEVIRKGHLTKLQKAVHVDNVKYIKSEQNIILPIRKHVWTKRRSLARIASELKIKKTIQLEFNTKYLCTHPKKLNKHHVKNARNGCSWEGILQNIMAVTCIEWGKETYNAIPCAQHEKCDFF